MAKLDKKYRSTGDSLSSFEKKGAKIAFNTQKRTKGKYKVVNVQSRNGDISSANPVVHGEIFVAVSENSGNAKSVKNTVNENKQIYRKIENRSHGTEHKPESAVWESEKTISPEMALRMKRAEFLAQQNEEALRLNRVTVIDCGEKKDAANGEQAEYSKEEQDVPPEHLDEKRDDIPQSSYLGNSEHAVFDTYNDEVRAYKAKNAYGKFIQKQKFNARNSGIDRLAETVQTVGDISRGDVGKVVGDAVIGSVVGENVQNAVSGIENINQAVSGSNSVGGAVLDVSATLAAIEAKKMVKKLAETDIKKKHRVDERMRNHGNRFGIEKYDEVTGKNEKTNKSQKESDRHSETAYEKQRSTKVGSSNKLQQEKQEYAKVQRAKEVRGRQKEIFIKENKKIPTAFMLPILEREQSNGSLSKRVLR